MKKYTQLYYAQKYLMQGDDLTQPFFSKRHGGWRLASLIEVLRNKYGWKIETVMVKVAKGNQPYALYRLPKEEKQRLQQLKKEGLMTVKSTAPKTKRGK